MSAYLGQRRSTAEDASAFERMELTGGDDELLGSFWDEAVGVLCLRLERYISAKVETGTGGSSTGDATDGTTENGGDTPTEDNDLTLTLSVSSRFNKGMEATLPLSVKSYIVSYILQRWCSVSSPGDAEYYAGLAAGFMSEVIGKVCSKTRPTRKKLGVRS